MAGASGEGAVLVKPGPLCTVQDLGRPTGRRQGISPGGAMDRQACVWANRLLGNEPGAAVLEITLGGAALRFAGDTTIALTGAECGATLDGQAVGNWRSVRVREGQTLRFGYSNSGMRAYLALPGGLDAPRLFGSASVVLREGLDGRLGRPMVADEPVSWIGAPGPDLMRSAPPELVPSFSDVIELPLITGYEWHRFSPDERDGVWNSEWSVDVDSDRIASRLKGPVLRTGPTALDSTPLVDGTVQVPGNGLPLIFMRDRPTVGGYPKLGSVDPGALDRLAQARPGTLLRFVPADPAAVLGRLRERRAFFGLT